ncbi:MAG: hypothetical protein K9G46_15525 [Flavobacteriales bacterium]|nr:hypothetical protein [Flavobacteriales bacterium]
MAEVRSKETEAVTVFRFSHTYDPTTKLDNGKTDSGRVPNGNPGASTFLTAIDGVADAAARNAALEVVIGAFSEMKTPKEVSALNSNLYDFGLYLKKFGPKTKDETLVAKTTGLSQLTPANLDTLWDNLYFQVVTGKSNKMLGSIVQLLRADAFLAEYTTQSGMASPTEEEQRINRSKLLLSAGANVEVPLKLVSADKLGAPVGKDGLEVRTKDHLQRRNNSDKARYRIAKINEAIEEVECAEKVYRKDYSAALQKATETDRNGTKYVSVANPTENFGRSPSFKFKSPFGDDYLGKYLSNHSKGLIESAKCEAMESLSEVVDTLKKQRKVEYRKVFRNATKPKRQALFAGIVIDEPTTVRNNSMIISSEEIPGTGGLRQLFVTQYFSNPETSLVSVEMNMVHPTLGTFNSAERDPLNSSDSHVTFLLFREGIPDSDVAFDTTIDYEVESTVEPQQMLIPELELKRFTYSVVTVGAILSFIPTLSCLFGNSAVKRIGVLEYKRVEQTVCCYVAGEVSAIENIMAREYREKVSRNLTRSEIIQEDTSEKEVENVTDTTTTDRYEMQTEIAQMMQEEQSQQIGVNAGGSAFFNAGGAYGGDVFANTNLNFTSGSASENSFSSAETFAQEVTQRAMERIVTKTTSRRTSRMLREYEETNTHGFDNRAGEKHVTGIYRWVDKIYKNELFNYGKRLQYEIMVPEPSRNFKKWMNDKSSSNPDAATIRMPRPLSTFGVTLDGQFDWQQITEDNYADLAAEYGADVDSPIASTVDVEKSFSENPGKTAGQGVVTGAYNWDMEIPEGYQTDQVKFHFFQSIHGDENNRIFSRISVGQTTRYLWQFDSAIDQDLMADWHMIWGGPVTGSVGVAVSTRDVGSFALNVILHCNRKAETYRNWQQQTYMAILDAYYKRMDEYDNAKAAANLGQDSGPIDYNFNPSIGRTIEQRELKRLCIEMMLEPWYKPMGQLHYTDGSCRDSVDAIALGCHAKYAKFMETAFDWGIFSYEFLPYYWAECSKWKDLIKEQSSADYLFQAFLQSGMAKITLPIKLGYEFRVLAFMETGVVFESEDLSIQGSSNPDLEGIKAELELLDYDQVTDTFRPEACWNTRVPTALTILQTDSAPLNANGLPCNICEDGTPVDHDGDPSFKCNTITGTPIASGNNLLAGLGESGSGGTSSGSSKSSFLFPKHGDLSSNDIGKLVMNDGDGLAKVSQLADPLTEQLGKYIIKLTDLGDIIMNSSVRIETGAVEVYMERDTWRNGNTPTDALAELNLLKDYIDADATLSANFTTSIVDDELVLEEIAMLSSEVRLSDWPDFSLEVVVTSQPASPAAPVGFPLGKLLGIDGSNAIISSELVETYILESAFSVSHELFNSGYELDITSGADLTKLTDHIIVPAANGKVKPAGLAYEDMIDSHFINTYRNQFVGVAINTSGMEVTVMRMSYLSFLTHGLRRMKKEGLLGND